jgi:hypothetical protein
VAQRQVYPERNHEQPCPRQLPNRRALPAQQNQEGAPASAGNDTALSRNSIPTR